MTLRRLLVGSLALLAAGCVNVDPQSGKTIPRGSQRYEFSRVTDSVDQLRKGMSKMDVLFVLGSPAEKDGRGDTWVYLPERPGVLLPARALVVKFRFNEVTEWGYHAIVLGQRL